MPAEGPLRDGTGPGFTLIETMRWEPRGGLVRRDLHFARLAGSARALGFVFSPREAAARIDAALEGREEPMRVRVELQGNGRVAVEVRPYLPLAAGTAWRLRIASVRLDSADPLLRHKTSRRAAYQAARAEFSADDADEVLLLNEKGQVCEGTITSLFVDGGDGALATPALAGGLLDGVLRRELIARGRAREAILFPADLTRAKRLFVGNSLRGLIPARLAQDG